MGKKIGTAKGATKRKKEAGRKASKRHRDGKQKRGIPTGAKTDAAMMTMVMKAAEAARPYNLTLELIEVLKKNACTFMGWNASCDEVKEAIDKRCEFNRKRRSRRSKMKQETAGDEFGA